MTNEWSKTPRLFTHETLSNGATLHLPPEQAHYLRHVLRLDTGAALRLFNGEKGEWAGTLTASGKRDAAITLTEQLRLPQPTPDLWLCAAPIKKNHFDYMIEKATELGIAALQPILTHRTQIREINLERATAIATEAAEQSERLTIPAIHPPLKLAALAANWPPDRQPIICAEWGDAQPVAIALAALSMTGKTEDAPPPLRGRMGGGFSRPCQTTEMMNPSSVLAKTVESKQLDLPDHPKAALFTGPEGGFTKEELDLLKSLPNALPIRLGPRILRADTAAIAALTCWQALCGDWR